MSKGTRVRLGISAPPRPKFFSQPHRCRRNGHSAGGGQLRAPIHNVKEPGAHGATHLEQNMNNLDRFVKAGKAKKPRKTPESGQKIGCRIRGISGPYDPKM